MEALQMLKFVLKKQRLNFTDGWAVPEEAMREVLKSDGDLTALFVDNSDAVMDGILQNFMSD